MTLVRLVSIFLVVKYSQISLQVTVELGIKVILGTTTSSKPMDSVTMQMVESTTLVITVSTGLLPLTLLNTLIVSTSNQVLLTLSTAATVLTVSPSVRWLAPHNFHDIDINAAKNNL